MTSVLNPQPSWASGGGHLQVHRPTRSAHGDDAVDRILAAETLHRFGLLFDEHDREGVADCFTEDAVWSATIAGTRDLGTQHGRTAVMAWLTAAWGTPVDQRRHLVTNTMVDDLDGDSATVTAMLLVTAARDGVFHAVTTGFYRTSMTRCADGAWRIARFDAGFDTPF